MHHYKLQFVAKRLDETALRELIEDSFLAEEIEIQRRPIGRGTLLVRAPDLDADRAEVRGMAERSRSHNSPSILLVSDIQEKLFSLFKSGKPLRRRHAIELMAPIAPSIASSALQRLLAKGAIQKVRNGVYIQAGTHADAADIPPLNVIQSGATTKKVLELVRVPRSAVQLRERLGVTRQRIEQILSKLESAGLVVRNQVVGERGQYVYVRTDSERRDALLLRTPDLNPTRARILSAMKAERIHRAVDLASVANAPSALVKRYLTQLSAQGLCGMFKLGGHVYGFITPRGLENPRYQANSPKAPMADIVADFGERRATFLQILSVLGEARTRELTYAVPPDFFDNVGYGPGNLIQRLTIDGLIQRTLRGQKNPLHKLTDAGQFVVTILNRARPAPELRGLISVIEQRKEEYREKQKGRLTLFREGSGQAVGSAAQSTVLEALRVHGALTQREITECMTTPFKNPRSLDQVLRSFEKRGIVRRLNAPLKGAPGVWQLVQDESCGAPSNAENA